MVHKPTTSIWGAPWCSYQLINHGMFTINRKISQPWRPWRPSRTSSPGRFVPDAPHAPQTTDVDRAPRNIAQQKPRGVQQNRDI